MKKRLFILFILLFIILVWKNKNVNLILENGKFDVICWHKNVLRENIDIENIKFALKSQLNKENIENTNDDINILGLLPPLDDDSNNNNTQNVEYGNTDM